jgi:hypothetical protein
MNLCTLCQLHLDPHIKNFIIKQNAPYAKPLITIVDTEDHQCMTGIGTQKTCSSYFEWYTMLAGKFLKSTLFKVKVHDT